MLGSEGTEDKDSSCLLRLRVEPGRTLESTTEPKGQRQLWGQAGLEAAAGGGMILPHVREEISLEGEV